MIQLSWCSMRRLLIGALVVSAGCGSDDPKPKAPRAAGGNDTGEAHADEPGHEEGHAEEGTEGTLALSEAAVRVAQIRVETARPELEGGIGEELMLPGQVELDPRRVAIISPRLAGRLERVFVVAGDRVRSGQPVASIQSREYLAAQTELLHATRRASALEGTADGPGARAIADAARRRLNLMGVGGAEIARLVASGTPRNELALIAPFSGSILEGAALPGQSIEAGAQIFKIADLSYVDVVAAVPERAVPLVHVGQEALIELAAFPQTQFAGTVERVRDELSTETRSVGAVIHAHNPVGRLRPGMFATVRLNVRVTTLTREIGAVTRTVPILTVADGAIVTDGDKRFVFIETGPRTYARREVGVVSLAPPGSSRSASGRVGITRGIQAGDRVVVHGAFVLKSELAKGGLGHDH